MDFLITIILVLLLFLVAMSLLIFLIIRFFKSNKKYKKFISIALLFLFLFIVFEIYFAFYPRESFYREEWKLATNFDLPKNIDFVFKDATYPDFHGDYISFAIIEVKEADYENIFSRTISLKSISLDTSYRFEGFVQYDDIKVETVINCPDLETYVITNKWNKNGFKIGFCSDRKRIIFQKFGS